MKGTKHQHVVAQSYLRRFAGADGQVFGFDKSKQRVFGPTSVRNVAGEAFFYDFPPSVMKEVKAATGVQAQFLEKTLAGADAYGKTTLDEILASVESRPITNDQRTALAMVVALQFMRTALSRELVRECLEKVTPHIVQDMLRQEFPDHNSDQVRVRVEFDPSTWAVQQAALFLNENVMVKIGTILRSHIWIFGINRSMQPLYTSDHPVAKNAHCRSGGIELTGLLAPGIEIAFPLSSRCVLYMLERTHFHRMAKRDGRAHLIDAYDVDRLNELQVRRSFRQVYCEKNEFEQAIGVCKRFPECCNPFHSRIEVRESESHILTIFRE
jgi:hypothetical protein